jgi:autotransporter-associated beta strand protein
MMHMSAFAGRQPARSFAFRILNCDLNAALSPQRLVLPGRCSANGSSAILLAFLAAAIFLLSPPFAVSQDWSVASGDWSTPTNWGGFGGVEPTTSSSARINNGGTASISQPGEVCYSLSVGSSRGNSGKVAMTGGTLDPSTSISVGSSGTGIFDQSGGTATTGDGHLYIGSNSTGVGTYYLSGSGQLEPRYGIALQYIGLQGTGTMNQSGGTNKNYNIILASINGSTGTYNLTGGTLITSSITKGPGTAAFNFGGGTIQARFNNTTFSLPMTITGDGGNANVDSAGNSVTLSGVLSGTGGLNKMGSGILTLSASNTYSGATTVNDGALEIAGGISPSGTSLIDVQLGTAILKTVDVNKTNLDITTAAPAAFEVVNGAHSVGAISGSGSTKIDAGASLTALSVSQGTITLAAGSTLTIAAIPGGPTGSTITPVPEPSACVLFATALAAALFAWRKKRE